MVELDPDRFEAVRGLVADEAPCAIIPHHPLNTRCGRVFCDEAEVPRWAALFAGGNLSFGGDADALDPSEVSDVLEALAPEWPTVFIDPPAPFAEGVRKARDDLFAWPRIHFEWPATRGGGAGIAEGRGSIRLIGPSDASALAALPGDIAWIHDTWGGPRGLAGSGIAVGAFDGDRLLSVAATFYLGRRYEEIGVVTAAAARGRGLSTACASALIDDILARGHIPCWSTTPDNLASIAVARRAGFVRSGAAMQFGFGQIVGGGLPLT